MTRLSISRFICRSLLSFHFDTVPALCLSLPTYLPSSTYLSIRRTSSPSTAALTRVGFCTVAREVGEYTRGCEFLKTDPLKFFRRFSRPRRRLRAVRRDPGLHSHTHAHTHEHIHAVPRPIEYTREETLSRDPFHFYAGFSPARADGRHSGARHRENKSPRFAPLSSPPITVANANNPGTLG